MSVKNKTQWLLVLRNYTMTLQPSIGSVLTL